MAPLQGWQQLNEYTLFNDYPLYGDGVVYKAEAFDSDTLELLWSKDMTTVMGVPEPLDAYEWMDTVITANRLYTAVRYGPIQGSAGIGAWDDVGYMGSRFAMFALDPLTGDITSQRLHGGDGDTRNGFPYGQKLVVTGDGYVYWQNFNCSFAHIRTGLPSVAGIVRTVIPPP